MQNSSHTNNPEIKKVDVFMLSESDVAFLNNEAPKSIDEVTLYDIDTASNFNTFNEMYNSPSLPGETTYYPDSSPYIDNQPFGNTFHQNMDTTQNYPTPTHLSPTDGFSTIAINEQLDSPEIRESDPLILSSVSETKVLMPMPKYSTDNLDAILLKIVTSEPLLTEDDLLYLIKKEYTGHSTPTRRTLRQILSRNDLQTEYKRFQAYISG